MNKTKHIHLVNYLVINEQDYVGNHVYNYLREYLFEHQNEFHVYKDIRDIPYKNKSDNSKRYYSTKSKEKTINKISNIYIYKYHECMNSSILDDINFEKEDYNTIECFPNSIKIISKDFQKIITFPTPYGQYYCFYDKEQLEYFKTLKNENFKDSIYILDLCEYVLKTIQKDNENELKIEKLNRLPYGKDRLNNESKFSICYGGFADTFNTYVYNQTFQNHFVIVNSKYETYNGYNLESKQSNENLLKFCLKNLLTSNKIKNNIRQKRENWFNSRMLAYETIEKNQEMFLKSISKSSNLLLFKDYSVLGIRFNYAYCYSRVKGCSNSFCQLKMHLNNIEKFIKNHNEIILMIDDWRFLKLFEIMFYDLLKGKQIQILININVNNVHELFSIAYNSKDFYHTHSGFYNLIDKMKHIKIMDENEYIYIAHIINQRNKNLMVDNKKL